MNLEIRDTEALRAIRPFFAASYLQSNGWKKTASVEDVSSEWAKATETGKFEVLLPMREGFRDYALRMSDMLQVLSLAEKRSQFQIYNDLLVINADVIRIRIADPELTDGSLPIEEHAQIAQRARDLVLAAACATAEHRAVWHNRKPSQATEYVRKVRIGQSERGSYVIKLISGITPLLQSSQDQLFDLDEPYERKVTQTLAHSLRELHRASEQAALTQSIDAFEAAVPDGVNANLCDAVVGLGGDEERQRTLEFLFSWSPARPVHDGLINKVTFSSDRLPYIREAGRVMREKAPLAGFELSGPVVKLERAASAGPGKVTIMGIVDERQVRISVDCDETNYATALEAHKEGKVVSLIGTLVKGRQSFELTNPCDLTIESE